MEKQKPEAEMEMPPSEVDVPGVGLFVFAKPKMKHRNVITKAMRIMSEQHADYGAIVAGAKKRKMSVEKFIDLPESAYTDDEKRMMVKASTGEDNIQFAEKMNDMLAETLWATIKMAPFPFETMEELNEKLDYSVAVYLFPTAVRWLAISIKELQQVKRPN